MSRTQTPLDDSLLAYVREVTLREPEALRRLRESTEDHPRASWQVAPEQGQFLHLLARLTGGRRALEVGIFMGYSSTWIALGLAPGGRLIVCDQSEEYSRRARRTWRDAGVEDRIELRLAPALDSLDALLAEGRAGSFDFIFIDADKGNYIHYYERALLLLRQGGLIAADNVLFHGTVADPANHDPDTEAIRDFNRHLHADRRTSLSMATMGDGLALAVKL
ncbi:MAG TPA: class I SAM-dependent methyltransferase [Bryobacteraceae bacterium]